MIDYVSPILGASKTHRYIENVETMPNTCVLNILILPNSLIIGYDTSIRPKSDQEQKPPRDVIEHANMESDPETSVPLKSHMKNKARRVEALKKAVARYISRGENIVTEDSDNDVSMAEPRDDILYESDYHDDFIR